jgi:hypothetical protein
MINKLLTRHLAIRKGTEIYITLDSKFLFRFQMQLSSSESNLER